MIADMHRARQLAWELPKHGWDVEVLAPDSSFQDAMYLDPESVDLFNPAVTFHRASPRDFWFFRWLGIRSLNWRSLWPLYLAGARLLRDGRFDLVFISTAKFNLFCLGRLWARRFSVPYVLDFHDPWVREPDGYRTTTSGYKRWFARLLAIPMEAFAVRGASGIVSVSPRYIEALRQRHGPLRGLRADFAESIPFAASERDQAGSPAREEQRSGPLDREIRYMGAGGSIMARSFETICQFLREVRNTEPELVRGIRISLYGTNTSWKSGDPKPLEELAGRNGLGDVVHEFPQWVRYTETMKLLRESDGLLILGVDSSGYMPSKLFLYALSGKPLLACFRSDSPAREVFESMSGLGELLTFDPSPSRSAEPSTQGRAAVERFLRDVKSGRRVDRTATIAQYTVAEMARRHAALFERVATSR